MPHDIFDKITYINEVRQVNDDHFLFPHAISTICGFQLNKVWLGTINSNLLPTEWSDLSGFYTAQ